MTGRMVAQVRKWVAIACPFGGAPGFCMDALLTGAQFTTGDEPMQCMPTPWLVPLMMIPPFPYPEFDADAPGWEQYFFVQRQTMRQLSCQSPTVFELLPAASQKWPAGHGVRRCTTASLPRPNTPQDSSNLY